MIAVAAHVSSAVEYALHSLLFLARPGQDTGLPSARDLAELQRIPADFLAKIMTRMARAGLVETVEGASGGLRLARAAEAISVLDVVRAVDGERRLFECREIRGACRVFDGQEIDWPRLAPCSIHAVMIEAQARMEAALAETSIAALAARAGGAAGARYFPDAAEWIGTRTGNRRRPNPAKETT